MQDHPIYSNAHPATHLTQDTIQMLFKYGRVSREVFVEMLQGILFNVN